MIKQTLFFTTPVFLSLKYNQLVIQREGVNEIITRPIEDIGFVIVENQKVRFTISLLNALADNHVSVVFCNDRSMPCSMLMSLDSNVVQQEVYRYQVETSKPNQKRIWKEVITAKIRNQAALLHRLGKDGDELKPYYTNVLSGDSTNREGIAARQYWKQLFGATFTRQREGASPNALLNYGYAILRAATTRALLGSGLFPAFGIFHCNRYNAFPLADDMMEPYRPFVDEIVYHLYQNDIDVVLDTEVKQHLVRVLQTDVFMNKQVHPLQIALTYTSASLVKALKDKEETVKFPTLL